MNMNMNTITSVAAAARRGGGLSLTESPFGSTAVRIHALGWAVFPQSRGDRRPGKVKGEMLRPQTEHRVHEIPLDAATLATWAMHCARDNVATVFGPRMPGLFAVDVDVTDVDMSDKIRALLDEPLGVPTLDRVGMAPKFASLYRVSPGQEVRSRSVRLADAAGDDSGHAVEVLYTGKTLTLHGIHHRTGNYYTWSGGNCTPLLQGPETATEVDAAQVDAFLAALAEAFPVVRASSFSEGRWSEGDAGRVRIAKVERADGAALATDGREELLRDLVWRTARLNGRAFIEATAGEPLEALVRDVAAATAAEFARVAVCDGKWSPAALRASAGTRVAALAAKIRSGDVRPPRGQGVVAAPDGTPRVLPVIRIVVGEIASVVDKSEAALAASDRGVYQRGDAYVEVGQVGLVTASGREISAQRIFPVDVDRLLEHVSEAAHFERWNEKKEQASRVTPPAWIARHLASRGGNRRLPVLAGVIGAPTLRPDGSALDKPGYDAATGLLFDPQGVAFPAVPAEPTKAQAEAALKRLSSLVDTFPFVSADDKAVALACLLTAVIRRSLPTAPMFAFSAPVAGSGKSTLVDIACILATGREAGVTAQASTDEEDEKRLASALIAGDPVISWDNVERPLGGPLFCQLLTQATVKPRILGSSKTPELPTSALVCATGNNLVLLADMTRRALLSTLDPGCERPELRVFETDPVAAAKKHRGEYVVAALTLLRAYRVAKAPEQGGAPLASFAAWSRWVRDALRWLGAGDACSTMDLARSLDPKLDALAGAMLQWRETLGGRRVTVREIIAVATEQRQDPGAWRPEFVRPDFREALLSVAEVAGNINSKRLARWLGAHAGRLVDGCRIVRDAAGHGGLQTWRLELSPQLQAEAAAADRAAAAKEEALARAVVAADRAAAAKEAVRAQAVVDEAMSYILPVFGDNKDEALAWYTKPSLALRAAPCLIAQTELGMRRIQAELESISRAKSKSKVLPLKR